MVSALILAAVLGSAAPAWAADREASRLVGEANRELAAGRTDDALKLYEEAAGKVADSPEVAYNRGVAYYRKGERGKAAEQFMKALSTRDITLEAKTRFNLGNCAYADALEKQSDVKAALEQLRLAISYYKDAIAADPNDLDAKVNIETAQLLMKHLLDQEKNKQEEQKDEQNDDEQDDSPQSQPASQPEQPQSQPASQPESDEKNEQHKDEQKQDGKEDQQGEQKEGQEQQNDDKQDSDGEGKKVEPQQQEGDSGEQTKDGQQGEERQVQEMTPEQAENLLQKIRDRERQRREALLRLLRMERVPVDKDW